MVTGSPGVVSPFLSWGLVMHSYGKVSSKQYTVKSQCLVPTRPELVEGVPGGQIAPCALIQEIGVASVQKMQSMVDLSVTILRKAKEGNS